MSLKLLAVASGLSIALLATAAQATTVYFYGEDYDSLHGSDGSLTIEATAVDGQYEVTWALDTTDFVGNATHTNLQSLAFKAFTNTTAVSVVSAPGGALYWPSNVNNQSANCDQDGSNAGFVCFDLVPDAGATVDATISATFLVTGTLDESLAWSFRGKYGPGNGWVISEQAPAIPEPTSAAVFGLGALLVGVAMRKRLQQ